MRSAAKAAAVAASAMEAAAAEGAEAAAVAAVAAVALPRVPRPTYSPHEVVVLSKYVDSEILPTSLSWAFLIIYPTGYTLGGGCGMVADADENIKLVNESKQRTKTQIFHISRRLLRFFHII